MRFVLVAILTLVGGWLRFTAVDFGLPDKFRPDEEYVVSRAVGFHRDANPNFSIYPAAQMYLQHGTLRAISAVEGNQGDFRKAFRDQGWSRAYLVGRKLSAAFGTATIPAVYWAAALPYGGPAGLAGAAVMTFATLHVRESKYATTDAAAVFWLTLALGMMFRVVHRGWRSDSLWAGVFAGLAIATKYPTGAVLIGLAVAHIGARYREGRSFWRVFRDIRPYITLFTTLTVFFCATPYILLDWEQTASDFAYQRGFVENGVGNVFAGWGWSWMLTRALPDSVGPILATALLASIAWNVLRPRPGTGSLLAFLVLACIGIASSRYAFYRYLLIPLPALAILLGIALADVRNQLGRWIPRPGPTALVSVGLIFLLVPVTIRDYKLNRLLARRDTRTMARQWVEENIPRGSAIAMSHHQTPYGKPQLSGYPPRPLSSVETLRKGGIRWILSDSSVLPFYSPGASEKQLADLNENATLVFDVDPIKPGTPTPIFDESDAFYVPLRHGSSVKRPGPRIRIWKIEERPSGENQKRPGPVRPDWPRSG